MSARSAPTGRPTAAAVIALLLISLPICRTEADQNDPRLDALFAQLQEAGSGAVAEALDRRIWAIWLESGSAIVDLMMAEGLKAMAVGRNNAALEAFDAAVETAPDFAEGWNKRATVYFLLGDYETSRRDAEKTLELEPRHFGAMSGLGAISLAQDRPDEALGWFRRALEIHPHLEGVETKTRSLEEKVEGRSI